MIFYYLCKRDITKNMKSFYRTIFSLLLIILSMPCFAQKDKSSWKKLSHKERLQLADSLRREMRHAADEGRLLIWGDSLLRANHENGKISQRRYEKLRKRLVRIDRKLYRGDSLLSAKYSKINVDTQYIVRPQGVRWTVKVRGNLSGAKIKATGQRDGVPFNGEVRSDYRGTMSFAVTYRGISLGFAVNPAKLAGKSKDNEMNIVSYGNKFGFDAAYLSSKTYSGNAKVGDVESPIEKGKVSQQALNFNAYYAFNGKKYSTPAAFTQSYIQRKSAGSFMLGLSFDGQKAEIASNAGVNDEKIKMKILEIGIGAGYGYNLVFGKHWLLHVSTLPTFDVYVRSHITEGDKRINMSYHFPDVIVTARGAVVYSWKQRFAGVSMVFTDASVGSRQYLHVMRGKWRARLFYGFRF